MAYVTPKVLITQEFTQVPSYAEFPLPAFILGPNYSLRRYAVQLEKQLTAVSHPVTAESANSYQYLEDVTYDFPNVVAGGDVDPTYTKVFAESVEASYFPNSALGSTALHDNLELVIAQSGRNYSNRVRFTAATLATANGYSRSAYFSGRDVKIGDFIEITDDLGNVCKSKIKGLHADTALEDGTLTSTIGEALVTGSDGVSAGTAVFTAVADAFTVNMVGQYITIATKGTYKILTVNSSKSVTLDAVVVGNSSALGFTVGGVYNDVANIKIQAGDFNDTPVYAWTGAGVDVHAAAGVVVANTSTAYKGYASKRILADTYVVEVTSGDRLTNVQFSVKSNAGAFVTKVNQSLTVGDLLDIDSDNGNLVLLDFTGTTNGAFELGQTWAVSVVAPVALVNPSVVAGSTYNGPSDMVYKLTVERGGAFLAVDGSNSATCARLTVASSGVDSSASVLVREDANLAIGNFGVSVQFNDASNNGGLIKGDVYYVAVVAEKLGSVRIVELSDNLSAASLEVASAWTAKLSLVQSSIEIPALRDILAETVNWSQEANYITIKSGITTYLTTLVALGEPARLPVLAAKLFVQHRDLLQNNINSISSVRTPGAVEALLGTVHPDNPLAQGVYDATLNSSNQIVYFIGVETDNLAGYNAAIEIAKKSDKVYSFAPMTFDRAVQEAVVSHVNAYSTPEVGRWRIAWLGVQDITSHVLYDLKEDGNSYTATITDDPVVSGTQYKLVTCVGANFITDGVRPNDKVRINFRLDPNSNVIYDEFTVDDVRTEESLTLTSVLTAPVNAPVKVNIVRVYTKDERATNIALIGGEYNNRRVRSIFPDTYKSAGVTKPGYFLAAALAGLRSSVVPHQGLTNTEFLGADDLSKVVETFTQDQLNVMAEQGIWLVTQEIVGATPYVRHQLTTAEASLNTAEDSITTNVDNISYGLKHALAPYIGVYNVNPENLLVVREAIIGELNFRATGTRTIRAGNQLTSFSPKDDILLLRVNPTFKDRIDVEVRLNVPYPLNFINLKLIV